MSLFFGSVEIIGQFLCQLRSCASSIGGFFFKTFSFEQLVVANCSGFFHLTFLHWALSSCFFYVISFFIFSFAFICFVSGNSDTFSDYLCVCVFLVIYLFIHSFGFYFVFCSSRLRQEIFAFNLIVIRIGIDPFFCSSNRTSLIGCNISYCDFFLLIFLFYWSQSKLLHFDLKRINSL